MVVGSKNSTASGPVIYRSTNESAYATWEAATLTSPAGDSFPSAAKLWAVSSRTGQTAVAVGSHNTIFYSQDKGRFTHH